MKVVITVIGKDQVGIVAKVSGKLAENSVNILDINQNIINGFFNMVVIAEMPEGGLSLKELQAQIKALGEAIGVDANVQHEDIFNAMHRI